MRKDTAFDNTKTDKERLYLMRETPRAYRTENSGIATLEGATGMDNPSLV